ncbi:hypothetical protein I302_102804 [Kwoniella bestiolae CBS 10118]|uniref:BTB domain-containing protein n=1 Tax=Kwoniella bestiolae CBS 10118 TaxID=1296100 RepID=A0A1B9GG01_9TREE|nr:hypothetical protein I302_01499 [Kwoniella bestiolae CBS 10118]OCF29982.1 hypothetical protein I302_01499 [Kwoniella bestiolae CBS 10118]
MTLKRSATSTSSETPNKKLKVEVFTINDTNRDYQDPKADITLVSSDGLRFKVHSYVLKTAGKEIELTDKLIERSPVLSLFLYLCHGKPMSFPSEDTTLVLYNDLIKFAHKYDSPRVLETLTTSVYRWHHEENLSLWIVLHLGLTLQKPKLVAFAIRYSMHSSWHIKEKATEEEKVKARNPVGTVGNVAGVSWLDFSAWSLSTFKNVPTDYMFALLRAYKHGGDDPEKVADGFLQIMKEMGE